MNQEQRIEYFMSEIARLSNQVVDLQDDRDALAAQVEALRDALDKIANWNECTLEFRVNYGSNGERDFYRNVAKQALAATPQQHLAEIRAEAVERSLKTLSHRWKPDTYGDAAFIRVSELNQYADSIRKGGAE